MKNKKEILIIVILILIQSIIYVFVGANKSYLHIDEAYSYGLTNYDKVEIEENADFYNTWHNKEYYEDYLTVNEDEIGDLKPVYENQKNDVHPPLYYLLLRIAMSFSVGSFSKWAGFGLNIVIYAFITIFAYLILKKMLSNEKHFEVKAAILAFVSSIVLSSISNVIYIRMYSLLTLEILITIYLHIKLLENEKINLKLLIGIGITALAGVLTHYYYLFFLVFLYLVLLCKYIKEKRTRELGYYTLTLVTAGIISLIIFPYSISHMFFGYRGQGVISSLEEISKILPKIFAEIHVLNYYAFNNLLYVIIGIILILWLYLKIRKKEMPKFSQKEKDILKIIAIPTICFFAITSIASPWQVLRYIVPVCGLIFIMVIYYLYKLLHAVFSEKIGNIIVAILLVIILISPFVFKLQPELWYKDKKEFVEEISEELNLPTIYVYSSQTLGFLNDILLFSKIDESYIAKDLDCTEENIQEIFENKDISKGIIIIISDNLDKNGIIETIKDAENFSTFEEVERLWCSNVYYVH